MDYSFLILVLILLCILVGAIANRAKKARLNAQIADAIENGRYTKGQIVAIQTPSNRKAAINVYLSYRDPLSGSSNLVRHAVTGKCKNIPENLAVSDSDDTIGNPDKDGYVKLAYPVDVDVYLHDTVLSGDGIYVAFKRDSEQSIGR